MKIILAFIIIIFLAFSGYHLTFRGYRLPVFAHKFYLTGTEFLFLGLLLGPQFLNLMDHKTSQGLEILSALLLGWIGLLFGFQFEVAKLVRFPFEFFLAAVFESLLTFVFVFLGIFLILWQFIYISAPMKIIASLILAAAAACTSQTGLALLAPAKIVGRKETFMLLRYISSMDGLIALLIFCLIFFFYPPGFSHFSWSNFSWLENFLSVLFLNLGAVVGIILIYTILLSQRLNENNLTAIVIAMAVLSSGIALIINFSPLLANFFLGFCLVNTSKKKERIFNMLIKIEKPVYLLILVFLGAGWNIGSGWFFLFAAGYSILRFSGKFLGGFIITRLSHGFKTHPRTLGLGLIDSGGLPLAILFDFQMRFPGEVTSQIIGLALIAVIYNDFLSTISIRWLLKKI